MWLWIEETAKKNHGAFKMKRRRSWTHAHGKLYRYIPIHTV